MILDPQQSRIQTAVVPATDWLTGCDGCQRSIIEGW